MDSSTITKTIEISYAIEPPKTKTKQNKNLKELQGCHSKVAFSSSHSPKDARQRHLSSDDVEE